MSEYCAAPTMNSMEVRDKQINVVVLLRDTREALVKNRELLEEILMLVANRTPDPFKGPEISCMMEEVAGLSLLAQHNLGITEQIKEALG